MNGNYLKKKIMARIYLEYAKNVFVEHPDYFMFTFFIIASFTLVSIRDVLINIPKDSLPNAFNFFVFALRETSFVMKALLVGFLVRITIATSKLAYRSVKNINTGWFTTRLKY